MELHGKIGMTEEEQGNYEVWKQRVNDIIIQRYGLDADDLPDYHWWAQWENGLTPHEAVEAFQEDVISEFAPDM